MPKSRLEENPEEVIKTLQETCEELTDMTNWEFQFDKIEEDGVTIKFRPKDESSL